MGFLFTSCKKDKNDPKPTANFTVTIENAFASKMYFANGTTGLIMPGSMASYTFHAGKGHRLSFATMFAQSNDLFYAPSMKGIPLYDGSGTALTGNITDKVKLWDAGTEVNEMPGAGANQAPRQDAPNTGADQNGTVQLIQNVMDGFTYPEVAESIKVMLTHDGGTEFTLTIENVSGSSAVPTPFAPGVWVIHSDNQLPLFNMGDPASPGLEAMAEDGDNQKMNDNLSSKSGLVSPFAPGAYMVSSEGNALWSVGQTPSSALESLAEDGNPSGFTNIFNTPVGASGAAPIFPGEAYSFSFSAEEGDKLSFATMLVQSNDWYIGIEDFELFKNGAAMSGNFTAQAKLYDAGSEMDEYPGAGNYQAPRQAGMNMGPTENGKTAQETATYDNLPDISDMIRLTITNN